MRFFEDDEDGTRSTDAGPAMLAAQRDLEDQIQDDADGGIRSARRNTAEIEHGHRLVATKPLMHHSNKRIRPIWITGRLLKEA